MSSILNKCRQDCSQQNNHQFCNTNDNFINLPDQNISDNNLQSNSTNHYNPNNNNYNNTNNNNHTPNSNFNSFQSSTAQDQPSNSNYFSNNPYQEDQKFNISESFNPFFLENPQFNSYPFTSSIPLEQQNSYSQRDNIFQNPFHNTNIFAYNNNNNYANLEQQQLQQYQYEVNNPNNLDSLFGVAEQDEEQNYINQHMIDYNNQPQQIHNQGLLFIPPVQHPEMKHEIKIDVILINEKTNETYAFDSQPLFLSDDKTFDIHQVFDLPDIRNYINENYFYRLKRDKETNIHIGKYPVLDKSLRFHRIDYHDVVLYFNTNSETKPIQRPGEMVSYENCGSDDNNFERDDDKRMEERTIREALQQVKLWRDTEEAANKRKPENKKKITLQHVADNAKKCKKKTLDYYFLELRKAEGFGFNFAEKLDEKMGLLRQFNQHHQERSGMKNTSFPKEINYQLPNEYILPLDEELIERLVQNAEPTSKNAKKKQKKNYPQQNRNNNQRQNPRSDNEDNDQDSDSDSGKNNRQEPIQRIKKISKSKSASPKNNNFSRQQQNFSNNNNNNMNPESNHHTKSNLDTYNNLKQQEDQEEDEEQKIDARYNNNNHETSRTEEYCSNKNNQFIRDNNHINSSVKKDESNLLINEDIFNQAPNTNSLTLSKFFDLNFQRDQSFSLQQQQQQQQQQDNLGLNRTNSLAFNTSQMFDPNL